jgi:predicted nuclease of predicted toxin-antitoxin system
VSDRPILYIDRCLGKAVAAALRAAGAEVRVHDDHFAPAAKDEDWIPQVAGWGWVVLTKDNNIRRRPGEREAVLLSTARVITLSSGNMRGADRAALFVSRLADLEQLAVSRQPPFVAVLSPVDLQIVFPRPGADAAGSNEPEDADPPA